jgi:hypothetical protein
MQRFWLAVCIAALIAPGCVPGSSGSVSSPTPAPCNLEYNLALVKPLPLSTISPGPITIYIASNATIAAGARLSVVSPPSSPIPGGTLTGPVPAPTPTPPLFQNPIFYESQFPSLSANKTYTVVMAATYCTSATIPGANFATGPGGAAKRKRGNNKR